MTERAMTPPRRTRFIGALNSAMTLARKTGLAKRPDLDKQTLLHEACAFTGLEDFGDPWFERPLTVLLD
ncbi:MAG TPA: sulfotransferase, partial [Croceibacterium sp.]|nr:sulfotransferase [Croceibacterium sp.]